MDREVELYAHSGVVGALWVCGSGLAVGGRLVLTAGHVVRRDGRLLERVQVRLRGSGLLDASVRWWRDDEGCDAALVEVTDQAWVSPQTSVRWGRLVTAVARRWEAVGFPDVVATPQRRDVHTAAGVVHPKNLEKAGRFALDIDHAPPRETDKKSPWEGMSGAAVMAEGLAVGVVEGDPAKFASCRLTATPVTAFLDDVQVSALLTEHTGVAPQLLPVELERIAEPVLPVESPAGLLRADSAPMRFRSRDTDLLKLMDWATTGGGWSAWLVAGPGGQGKSRLARELAERLTGQGWAAVHIGHRASKNDLGLLGGVRNPLLVVVDYAESRIPQLDAIHHTTARAEMPVRVLLLARTAGAWLTDHPNPTTGTAFLATIPTIPLGPLEPAVGGREQAWSEATRTLAPLLADIPGYEGVDWGEVADTAVPPTLAAGRYGTALEIYLDALATLLRIGQPDPATSGDPLQVVLEHERRYWSLVATQHGVTLSSATQCRAVTYATLYGATSSTDADRILTHLPGVRDLSEDERDRVSGWLAGLYRDHERYWSSPQPDRIAEHLLATTLTPTGACYPALTDIIPHADAYQIEHALTLLVQAHVHHPDLTETITTLITHGGMLAARAALVITPRAQHPQPLITALTDLVTTADLHTLTALDNHLPRHSLALSTITLLHAQHTTKHYRQLAAQDPDTYLPNLATSLHTLVARLGEGGRRAEGLEAAQEAVELWRELADRNRDTYLPDLATSLHNLGSHFGEAGRRAEALEAAQEATELRRELADRNRHAYLPDLAMSLNNLAIWLAQAGHHAEALRAAQEAVKLWRELAARNRLWRELEAKLAARNRDAYNRLGRKLAAHNDPYLANLAMSLHTLANQLGQVDHRAKALEAAQEATELRRELADRNRDAYLPDLAMSLNNLAIWLAKSGQRTEALEAAQEAVDSYRELATGNRDAYLPKLATSLNNLAHRLDEAGRPAEALEAVQEAMNCAAELEAIDADYTRDIRAHSQTIYQALTSKLDSP